MPMDPWIWIPDSQAALSRKPGVGSKLKCDVPEPKCSALIPNCDDSEPEIDDREAWDLKGDGKEFSDAGSDYREAAATADARLGLLVSYPSAPLSTASFFSNQQDAPENMQDFSSPTEPEWDDSDSEERNFREDRDEFHNARVEFNRRADKRSRGPLSHPAATASTESFFSTRDDQEGKQDVYEEEDLSFCNGGSTISDGTIMSFRKGLDIFKRMVDNTLASTTKL